MYDLELIDWRLQQKKNVFCIKFLRHFHSVVFDINAGKLANKQNKQKKINSTVIFRLEIGGHIKI